jgi:hypothetical protein
MRISLAAPRVSKCEDSRSAGSVDAVERCFDIGGQEVEVDLLGIVRIE